MIAEWCVVWCVQCPSVDVKQTLYQLLYELLQYNWRYFFHSSIKSASSQLQQQHADTQQQFIAVIQVCPLYRCVLHTCVSFIQVCHCTTVASVCAVYSLCQLSHQSALCCGALTVTVTCSDNE